MSVNLAQELVAPLQPGDLFHIPLIFASFKLGDHLVDVSRYGAGQSWLPHGTRFLLIENKIHPVLLPFNGSDPLTLGNLLQALRNGYFLGFVECDGVPDG
ncbi:MAG: hypothetical protein ABL888_22650 [Pirellulaceae bacterium]